MFTDDPVPMFMDDPVPMFLVSCPALGWASVLSVISCPSVTQPRRSRESELFTSLSS